MRDDETRQRTEKILADSRRLIAQVDAALAEGKRVMEARGWTREYVEQQVKRLPARVREQLQAKLDEQLARVKVHQAPPPRLQVSTPGGGLTRLRRASRLV